MDNKFLNTTYDFELADGQIVKLTLAFYHLYQLKNKNRGLYDRYNKIMTSMNKNNTDILDMVTIVYVGYVCANMDAENLLSEEDFLMLCGSDIKAIGDAMNHLIRAKKA